jgi:hypothetical protein
MIKRRYPVETEALQEEKSEKKEEDDVMMVLFVSEAPASIGPNLGPNTYPNGKSCFCSAALIALTSSAHQVSKSANFQEPNQPKPS